ncbi:sigma-70 family RNA polymerase sigma factor [Radiobacillus deserti]|uniref:sigma-70 family RNA polymerase sigma factor n=1 Tax=Radiobacillus deserti TaxID=2594883 RepID=UPI00131594EF|nr:sigma-70 family RNA polymerase sigma factor [Radiobacillus deserti]
MEVQKDSSSERALEEIMDAYGEEVKRLIFSYIKEWNITDDLTQDTFLSVYLHLDSFQSKSKLRTWIYSIAINKCKDYLKSWKYKKVIVTNKFFGINQTTNRSPSKWIEEKESKDELIEKVLQLPTKYREPILLYYFQYFTITEISEITKIKASTIKTRIHRAKKLLRVELEGDIDE